MVNMVFMILFFVIALAIFGYSIYRAVSLARHPMPKTIEYSKEIKRFIFFILGATISATIGFIFLCNYQGYLMNGGEWASLVFGSLIFSFSLATFVNSFIVHYYGKEIDKKSDTILFYSLIISAFTFLFGLVLLTNGIADHLTYPLVNGINFQNGFTNPSSSVKPNLAWYALCILSGAVLVYFICDHRFYVEYGKHGILESTFFIAFPAGIIGARIGFVIGEWNKLFASRVASGEWWAPFAIWEGGLTIISGALIGIIVGVIWFIWRNKKYSIWLAVDIIVPCILVAQAIGRWGNFFNAEVHGNVISTANFWWLPKIVMNNAAFSERVGFAPVGSIYLPLFYIEFISNLVGYFTIRFAIGKGLRKYLELGDLAALYIVWYGLTRVILEPLRHPAYHMGIDGYWSWMWSIIFVLVGTFFIMANHVVRYLIRKKKNLPLIANVNLPLSYAIGGALLTVALGLTITGTIFMSSNPQSAYIGFNPFNNGFIILTIGLAFLMIAICALIYILQGKKKEHES